jgi:catechol 2,3-dioxygenase
MTAALTVHADRLPEATRLGRAHLSVTDLERAARVWRDLIGLSIISRGRDSMKMGVGSRVLIAFSASAREAATEASLGLHHVALHLPSGKEFARVATRLGATGRSLSAVDRTAAKAIYLSDDDGIGIELMLETPHRGRLEVVDGSLRAVSTGGEIRPAGEPLDLGQLRESIRDLDCRSPLPVGTTLGHVHLSVRDLDVTNRFYADVIGFEPLLQAPSFGMYDVGTSVRPHMVAFSNWAATRSDCMCVGAAGLNYFTIEVPSRDAVTGVAERLACNGIQFLESTGTLQTADPDGNRIVVVCTE